MAGPAVAFEYDRRPGERAGRRKGEFVGEEEGGVETRTRHVRLHSVLCKGEVRQ